MVLLLYEDSFEGLLSALFAGFGIKGGCTIMRESRFGGISLFETRAVKNDPVKNDRILRGMDRLGKTLALDLYHAWLSELPDIEDYILEALKLGFAKNMNPMDMLYSSCVKSIESARHKVWGEAHLYFGILRFHEAGPDIFVADIEPKYRILPVIAGHFHERFLSMRFVIRDLNRRSAVVSEPGGWYITELPDNIAPLPENGVYEKLWKQYFNAVAIQNRINPKLQQSFLPLGYRAYLHEFTSE